MDRKASTNLARVGAQKLWAGTVHIHPGAKTGAEYVIDHRQLHIDLAGRRHRPVQVLPAFSLRTP